MTPYALTCDDHPTDLETPNACLGCSRDKASDSDDQPLEEGAEARAGHSNPRRRRDLLAGRT